MSKIERIDVTQVVLDIHHEPAEARSVRGGPSAIRSRLHADAGVVIMTTMRKTSVVKAKAHFSELVDLAEHKGHRILVCRHGKPAAAIVPVAVATAAPEPAARRGLTDAQIIALFDGLGAVAPHESAVRDLEEERSRLDRVHR